MATEAFRRWYGPKRILVPVDDNGTHRGDAHVRRHIPKAHGDTGPLVGGQQLEAVSIAYRSEIDPPPPLLGFLSTQEQRCCVALDYLAQRVDDGFEPVVTRS